MRTSNSNSEFTSLRRTHRVWSRWVLPVHSCTPDTFTGFYLRQLWETANTSSQFNCLGTQSTINNTLCFIVNLQEQIDECLATLTPLLECSERILTCGQNCPVQRHLKNFKDLLELMSTTLIDRPMLQGKCTFASKWKTGRNHSVWVQWFECGVLTDRQREGCSLWRRWLHT